MLFAQMTLPPPEVIRRKAEEVVARPDYDLGRGGPATEPPLLLEFIRWILTPFRWLYESLEGVPDFLRWVIVAAASIICVALISHITYTLASAMRGPLRRRGQTYESAAREVDPTELEREANLAGGQGDYIGAIRLLFRASLRRIELAERKKPRPGFTNRELLRCYRASPLSASLERFVETIETKWYGNAPCEQADYVACRGEHERICQYIHEPESAHRA